MGIAPIIILKDAVTLDYCFIQCIKRCLELPYLDAIYINEGYSSDTTFQEISALAKDTNKIKLFRRQWCMDKEFWAREKNFLIEEASKYSEYIFIVDADEILLKSSLGYIKKFVENPGDKLGVIAYVYHYMRISDGDNLGTLKQITRPGWYRYQARLIHRSLNPRLMIVGANPDDLVGFKGNKMYFIHHRTDMLLRNTDIRFAHFGYARDAKAMSMKWIRSEKITRGDKEFVNGNIPEPQPYTYPTWGSKDLIDPLLINPGLLKDELVIDWVSSKYRKHSYP